MQYFINNVGLLPSEHSSIEVFKGRAAQGSLRADLALSSALQFV